MAFRKENIYTPNNKLIQKQLFPDILQNKFS